MNWTLAKVLAKQVYQFLREPKPNSKEWMNNKIQKLVKLHFFASL